MPERVKAIKPDIPRLTDRNMTGAPTQKYVGSIQQSVNLLADHVERIAGQPQQINLLANANVELVELTVQVPDPWIKVGTTGAPAFQNSWTNYNLGFSEASFMKHPDGTVEVKGTVASGTAIPTVIFTLPVNFRPPANVEWATPSNVAPAHFIIGSDGTVNAGSGGTGTFSINCRFLAKDSVPFRLSCWPKLVKTKLQSVAGVVVVDVKDHENTAPLPTGHRNVEFELTAQNGQSQLKILNIPGLPYNRKCRVKLLIFGGM